MGRGEGHPEEERSFRVPTQQPATGFPGRPVGRMGGFRQMPGPGGQFVVGYTVAVILPGQSLVLQPLLVVVPVQSRQQAAFLERIYPQ